MYLLDAIQAAGRNGVVARQAPEGEPEGRSVVLIRKFERLTGKLVAMQCTEHDMGNWEPSLEDKTAQDWYVVAKSLFEHTPKAPDQDIASYRFGAGKP